MGRIRRCRSEQGQTMAEYAFVLAIITPAVVLAFSSFSGAIGPAIQRVLSFF